MRAPEARDAGRLAGTALDGAAEIAQDVHRAVAGHVFGLLGPRVAPIRVLHDSIATVAYRGTRLAVRTLPAAAGALGAELRRSAGESVHDYPRAAPVLAAINGWAGDRLHEERSELASRMRMRTEHGRLRRSVRNVVHDLADRTAPPATGRIVVFLHGLVETDRFWHIGAERVFGDPHRTYGAQLRDDLGYTPLYVSYNTGRHVSENGALLHGQLGELVEQWPVPVESIVLVGHSMGGLIVRSAAAQAALDDAAWVRSLRHVVGLGTPNLGAPLERFANLGTWLLDRTPESRPFARWLNRRSAGIKDMRYGSTVELDWRDFPPDELWRDRCSPAELLPHVTYSSVSATLTRRHDGLPLFVGDLLVWHGSATGVGRKRSIGYDPGRTLHIGGRHHFHLLADPDVYAQLRDWLR